MSYKDFTIWLDGFLTGKDRNLTVEETKIINDKLNTLFTKVTFQGLSIEVPEPSSEIHIPATC